MTLVVIFIFIHIGAPFWERRAPNSKSESLFECRFLLFCLEGLPLILGGQEGGCCCIRLENWIGSWDSPKQFLTAIVLIQQDWTNNAISFWEKGHMFFPSYLLTFCLLKNEKVKRLGFLQIQKERGWLFKACHPKTSSGCLAALN